ncbi:hypothetical protein [Sporichthya sp.]|uniref:hypothetical protein n=1 Tax=Sporichthya sp. TaxID=65475 RepID=UPI0018445AD1|nr:hypothetical protein [Sporichthya sp.]MBA3745328.1 hypothetical protein [Sporichthya sp.]
MPGDEGYEAFQEWQAQQDAFWSAYGAGEFSRDEAFPDLPGSRTEAGLLAAVERAAKGEARGRSEAAGDRRLHPATDGQPRGRV